MVHADPIPPQPFPISFGKERFPKYFEWASPFGFSVMNTRAQQSKFIMNLSSSWVKGIQQQNIRNRFHFIKFWIADICKFVRCNSRPGRNVLWVLCHWHWQRLKVNKWLMHWQGSPFLKIFTIMLKNGHGLLLEAFEECHPTKKKR